MYLLRLLIIFVLAISISACSLFREEVKQEVKKEEVKQEIKVTTDKATIKGTVTIPGLGPVPVDVTISQSGKEETKSKSEVKEETIGTKDTSSPAAETGFGWFQSFIILLLGGGGVGAVINKIKNNTISRITEGVDSFLEEDPKAGNVLKTHLSKKLDRADKELIKKVKK
jgi:hypothetical protein